MGIEDKLNSSFNDVSSFAAAAGAGVQEDISPLRDEIAALRDEVSQLRTEIETLQSQSVDSAQT
jgi:cell division protein FtsB